VKGFEATEPLNATFFVVCCGSWVAPCKATSFRRLAWEEPTFRSTHQPLLKVIDWKTTRNFKMIAHSTWKQDAIYEAHSETNHTITFDAGDHTQGPTPMEAVLMALCGCTSVDVVSILQKKREPIASLTVSATAEQAPAPPRVFTKIHLTYKIGGAVSRKAAEDAVSLSKNKYCSVSKMLEKAVEIGYTVELAD